MEQRIVGSEILTLKKYLNQKMLFGINFKTKVVRSLKNRKGWDKNWYRYANSPIIRNKFSINDFNLQKTQFDFCIEKFSFLKKYPEKFQPIGETYAFRKYLISFLKNSNKL